MSSTVNYWKKQSEKGHSSPDMKKETLVKDVYGEDPLAVDEEKENFRDKINKKLLKYKEIRLFSKKTHIEPFFISIIMFILLIVILIGYFDKYLTVVISIFYPLFMSFKVLQFRYRGKGKRYSEEMLEQDTIQWLSYWLFYSFIINVECIMEPFIKRVRFYNFIKVVLLLLCFLPQFQLSVLIYNYITKKIYGLYGEKIENAMKNYMKKMASEDNNYDYYKQKRRQEDNDNNDWGRRKME